MPKETEVNVYRKVPIKIRAIKWDGTNFGKVALFCNKIVQAGTNKDTLLIDTPERAIVASIGDYIIQGVNGEYYPCKPDIFKRTYERLNQFDEVIDFE